AVPRFRAQAVNRVGGEPIFWRPTLMPRIEPVIGRNRCHKEASTEARGLSIVTTRLVVERIFDGRRCWPTEQRIPPHPLFRLRAEWGSIRAPTRHGARPRSKCDRCQLPRINECRRRSMTEAPRDHLTAFEREEGHAIRL